ncbi:MAG: ABC transporter ATP-binding protein [Arenicellales bacterium]|jgi:branched-chain amino acid transport system ATP-binding protein|nr:ABC transporter ATP-binding protein [Arenicellales bacterium]|tara:strand:- start:169 stop:876 length:708 start_codon:yes stop_codon:yes gene_type:complete
MESLLTVEGVKIVYNRKITAVHDLDLTVEKGKSVAILGANGAGKSSIMRALAGWHPPAEGRVRFDGVDITRLVIEKRARMGLMYVPESGHIFQRLSVRENMLMGGYLLDHPEAQIEKACRPFPVLLERMGQLAGTLSGGERQMLAIARAGMSSPKLLLVDEVSLGLMPQAIEVVFQALRDLMSEGVSVVLAEQNARKAMEVVDHVYLLENGRIALSGPPQEIVKDSRVIAAYLGG